MINPNINNSARKKIRLIRWCLIIAVLIVVAIFSIKKWGLSDTEAKKQMIDLCIDTGSEKKQLQQQLEKYHLQGKSTEFSTAYCHCMWDPFLKNMSANEIRAFVKKSGPEQIKLLGGEEAITTNGEKCLSQTAKQLTK